VSDSKTQQYIFEEDAGDYFYDFLEQFHENFVDDMIMTGTGKIGQNVEDVKMITLDNGKELCEQMLGGMLKFKPFLHIRYADNILCNVYALKNEIVEGVYMVQRVMNYPRRNYCLWSFWKCGNGLDVISDLL
tara:strand:- start:551 stop:946 length:396 start_codon:yes stop_codon:yes gene_type:complete